MDGLLLVIGLVLAVLLATRFGARMRRRQHRGPEHSTEPPGERSAPDDWPRDGHGPPAP